MYVAKVCIYNYIEISNFVTYNHIFGRQIKLDPLSFSLRTDDYNFSFVYIELQKVLFHPSLTL